MILQSVYIVQSGSGYLGYLTPSQSAGPPLMVSDPVGAIRFVSIEAAEMAAKKLAVDGFDYAVVEVKLHRRFTR